MKIDNSNIYLVDIYKAVNTKVHEIVFGADSIGGFDYTEKLNQENVVCIKVGCMYVPVDFIENIFNYLEIMSHKVSDSSVSHPDFRFLSTHPHSHERGFFVKNIRPLYKAKGKTKIKDLKNVSARFKPIEDANFVDISDNNVVEDNNILELE